ncbi:MAG: glycine cleavage system protein GcvH [Phycisphaerae bacterium]
MVPDDLLYTEQHEWIRVDGQTGTVGITEHAQEQLGDLTFVELPDKGKKVRQGEEALSLESCKAAASVYAPAGGEISEVNDSLEDDPGLVNSDPYTDGWIYRLTLTSPADLEKLMKPTDYEKFLAAQDD